MSKLISCPMCDSNEISMFIDDVTNRAFYYCNSCTYTDDDKEQFE